MNIEMEYKYLLKPMFFLMLLHDPLSDCLNFKENEYWNLMLNLNMAPIHVKCVKITVFILASMGLYGDIIQGI